MAKIRSERLDQLTFTRCIAALVVVCFHFGEGIWPIDSQPLADILRAGPQVVTYFYVLSGFLMTAVHFNLDWSGASDYWISRFARIYPVYILGLFSYLWLMPDYNMVDLLLNLTLIQAWFPGHALSLNTVGWSLSVEVLFYALFPLLIIATRRTSTLSWCFIVFAVWLCTQVGASFFYDNFYTGYPSASHEFLFYFPLIHLNSFLLGMTAALLVQRDALHFGATAARASVVFSLVGIALGLHGENDIYDLTGLHLFGTVGFLSPVFALLIAGLCSLNAPVLAATPLRFLGQASYAVYILQIPVMIALKLNFPDLQPAAFFWILVAVLTIASSFVFVAFETPCRHLVRKTFFVLRRRYSPAPMVGQS
ncbi:MAG: acyltransferase [Rhodomicrobium sp.]